MKVIVCGKCHDVRALRDRPVRCECGNVTGWWVDGRTGTAQVAAHDRDKAKIMGIMNGLFRFAFAAYDYSDERWREKHLELAAAARGYLFHETKRACPVVICAVGNSVDVSWADVHWRLDVDAGGGAACEKRGEPTSIRAVEVTCQDCRRVVREWLDAGKKES